MSFDVLPFIETKRDGGEHAPGEMKAFVEALQTGKVKDYQVSAWLMAAFLRGLSPEERRCLTECLADSGQRMELPPSMASVDKHSTGGVGDKTTLVLVPLVASCGVPVAKLSGRGLGFTGGTVDKLEAIPGMRTHLEMSVFRSQVERIGCAVSGHSAELAPAEGKLYALRDVTGTVPSKDLITTSIVSKKIAGGARSFVYDVKWGNGALMERFEEAEELARLLVDLSRSLGHPSRALLTSMEQPLGQWVGNAAEVREAVTILQGGGPASTREVCLALGGEMLCLAGAVPTPEEGERVCGASLAKGNALEKFRQLLEAQGGDPRVADTPEALLPLAEDSLSLAAAGEGWLASIPTRRLGEAVRRLGGGRLTQTDTVDPGVALRLHRNIGDPVSPGEPLATLYGRDKARLEETRRDLEGTFEISPRPVEPVRWVRRRLG